MKEFSKIILFLILAFFIMTGSAMALNLGSNITISDEVSSGTGWYSDREDQEVEPNCVPGQGWDLEGFFLNGTTLTMIGGYNFKDGYGGYQPGDIFIDTTGDAEYGPGNTGSGSGYTEVVDNFGYEFALDLDFDSGQYTVYGLTGASTVAVWYGQNDESNPLEYKTGGTEIFTFAFTFYEGLDDDAVAGLEGGDGSHYAVDLDLSDFLTTDEINSFIAHFTYQCGNDNLMGSNSNPVPEPATMMLFGTGLIGMAALGRKKFRTS